MSGAIGELVEFSVRDSTTLMQNEGVRAAGGHVAGEHVENQRAQRLLGSGRHVRAAGHCHASTSWSTVVIDASRRKVCVNMLST